MSYFFPAVAGLLTGAGLIIAIGAQNVFVLRQGIRREHVLPVVAVCTASDIVLILAGVIGLGAVVTAHPEVVDLATFAVMWWVFAADTVARQGLFQSGWFVVGLLTRLSALGLLGMTLVIQFLIFPEAWWPTHSLWAGLALVLISRGGGLFSLDAALVRARR